MIIREWQKNKKKTSPSEYVLHNIFFYSFCILKKKIRIKQHEVKNHFVTYLKAVKSETLPPNERESKLSLLRLLDEIVEVTNFLSSVEFSLEWLELVLPVRLNESAGGVKADDKGMDCTCENIKQIKNKYNTFNMMSC